jgi:hypothetical protein
MPVSASRVPDLPLLLGGDEQLLPDHLVHGAFYT